MKIDQRAAREMNRLSILNLLRTKGPLSRAEIAAEVGLSAASVTIVTGDLLQEALIVEGKPSQGAMGRRPIPIDLNYSGLLAVGHKVMLGSVESVLTDLSTTPLLTYTSPLPDQRPETVVKVCAQMTERLMREGGGPEARLIGVGLALPGVVKEGVCLRSHRFNWTEVPIANLLAEELHVPVWAEDDTNAFALGQQLFRFGRNHRTIGALAIGTGISCAVVIDGSVHHGANAVAGNIGHSTFDPNGPQCDCGRRGCLQAFFSEPAMVRQWRTASGAPDSATRTEMLAAAEGGDPVALDVLARAGRGIGSHLAFFSNIIDPEIIVVGGEAVLFGDFLFGPMREAIAQGTIGPTPHLEPDWTETSWAQGAAALATRHIFDLDASKGFVRTS